MKSLFQPTLASLLAIALLGAAISTQAADTKPEAPAADAPKAEAPPAPARAKPYGGTLGALDKTAMTITVKKKTVEKTFTVTSSTKIMKAGKPATLEDGVVGEEVGVSYLEADGKAEAKSIRFGAKPEKAKKEKTEKADGEEAKPADKN